MPTTAHTLLIPNQVDEVLAAHFAALGVGTIAAYKLWCYRHGLSTALDKTPQARAAERGLFASLQPAVDPAASKEHDPRRAALIRRLFNGELAGEKLNDLLSRLRVERNALAGDPATQKALGRLVLHVEKYGHLLRPMPVLKRLGANRANTYIAALGQLARHHRDWLRSVEEFYDYIRHQKYRPQPIAQPDGTQVEGPPPQPNFCMKGRSAAKLLNQVDEWHEMLSGAEDVPLKTWVPTGLAGFCREEYDAQLQCHLVWTIDELCTSQQLQAEGRIMGHCVFSYTDRCLAGETSIWSLRALNADAEEALEKRVLTIAVDNRQRAVTQARGKFNMALNQRERLEKKRRAGSLYVHLLRESARILHLWTDEVGLVQKSA